MPNLGNNPLLRHGGLVVHDVKEAAGESLAKDVVSKVKASMTVIHAKLVEAGLIEGVHAKCKVCLFASDQFVEFKVYLQTLMD